MTDTALRDPALDPPLYERQHRRVSIGIFVLVLAVTFPLMQRLGEQQASRLALTAALWEDQSVAIDDYAHLLGRDRAVRDGVTYSDKAPGQAFLAVPFYGIYRLFGDDPAGLAREDVGVAVWWLTVWLSAVPAALLAVLMYRWARQVEPSTALAASLTMALGSLIVVYSTLLFGHVLAALLAFGMFLLVRDPDASARSLLIAGFLGGAAVLVEYPVALVAVIVTIGSMVVHRTRGWLVVAGGLPAALALGLYNFRVTGSPFIHTYQWTAFSGPAVGEQGVFEIFRGPSLERLTHILFSQRGLLIATPVVLVALVGLVLMYRHGKRIEAIVVASIFLAMLAIQALWANSYAGGAGPRYIVPALPFLAAPLAVFWRQWRIPTTFLAGLSVLTMLVAVITDPQLPSQAEAGLGYWLRLAAGGHVVRTLFSTIANVWGWVIHGALVAGAATYLLKARSRPTEEILPSSLGTS